MDSTKTLSLVTERIKSAVDKNSKTLDLSNIGVKKLPNSIFKFKELIKLYGNKLNDNLPEKINEFMKLSTLNLSDNPLERLPISISEFGDLTHLSCSNTDINELPDEIGRLTGLKVLELGGSKLLKLPKSISHLKKLEQINLSDTQLEELPDIIASLTNLKRLYLMKTRIEGIPNSLTLLINLEIVNFSYSQIHSLPHNIGRLQCLHTLNLDSTKLNTLPDSIGQLRNLMYLYLNDNSLKELPDSICQLYKLNRLEIRNNKLISIPLDIGKLCELKTLELQNNQLTKLPDSIGQLRNLSILRLNDNKLKSLPPTFEQLNSLITLALYNNEDIRIPSEILGSKEQNVDPKKIIEYYIKVLVDAKPLNEAKLIIVGFGAVGKTSIVRRLIDDKFDPHQDKTNGIDIKEWRLEIENNWTVRLNVWDFGGQEIMHSTHQFFLTQRSLYLLVLNGRKGHEDADAEYWLKLIESFGKESSVIIVLNKFKEHPFDVNRRALTQKYKNIHKEFVETDCGEPSMGIATLREVIKNVIKGLKHIRDPFPANWFSIKDNLATMEQNYISYLRYQHICEENGVIDSNAQDTLAFALHSLGIILNFKDDMILRFTNVLNPHWVTNGIYEIINSTRIYDQKGILCEDDVKDILDSQKYPINECKFIIRLMQKFELCFEIPNNENLYLITELLGLQQPKDAEEFDVENCLNFQYHYKVLPPGLLPRFIVRTHAIHYNDLRWLTGVILKFDNNLALVKVDKEDKKVLISIKGPLSTRRELLSIIRCDFRSIHNFFASKPSEMVPISEYPGEFISYQELEIRKKNNETQFTRVIRDTLVKLYTHKLLNGIELGNMPDKDFSRHYMKINIFCSYSHKDKNLFNEFIPHLKLLKYKGIVDFWVDTQIAAGENWKQQIEEHLERAQIILLFLSVDYFTSDYCEYEMMFALKRRSEKVSTVIPVLLRDVNFKDTPIEKLQIFPRDGIPVENVTKFRDTVWKNISNAIEEATNNY